jgi:hypothetical protein
VQKERDLGVNPSPLLVVEGVTAGGGLARVFPRPGRAPLALEVLWVLAAVLAMLGACESLARS